MSDAFWTALFAVFGSAIAAYMSWRNKLSIHNVHIDINGRLNELLKSKSEEAFNKGRLEGEAANVLAAALAEKLRVELAAEVAAKLKAELAAEVVAKLKEQP